MTKFAITLTPTDRITRIDGTECRIWTGTDQNGIEIEAAIKYVMPKTHDKAALAQFEENLSLLPEPNTAMVIDYRFIV